MHKSIFIKEKGVSEVVGTILILAITVVLFGTIFTYVQHIPPPQKTGEMIIQSSISVSGNNTIVQLTDLSGSQFSSNYTYLDIIYGGSIKSIPIYEILKKPQFGPGDTVSLNLLDYGITVQNTSELQLIIFSKQYNQILWHTSGYNLSNIYILNAYAVPIPINPNSYFNIIITVYSIYNNTTLNVNLTKFLGKGYNFTATLTTQYGNFRDYYLSVSTPANFNVSSEYAIITAKSGNKVSIYNLSLYASNSESPDIFIEKQGISLQNPRPVHGSSDTMEILVKDNSAIAGTFNLFIYDKYPNGTTLPIQTNFGSTKFGQEVIINSNFSVGGFSTETIYLIWDDVGGNGPGAGNNVLIAGLVNIKGINGIYQVPNPPNETYNVYVEPKILLVNGQGIYSGTNEDVSEYYKVMLDYSGYTSDYISVSNGQYVNLSGYDLVIWFTGANPDGISNELSYMENFYEAGGKVLIVAPNAENFPSSFNFQNYVIENSKMNISSNALKTLNITQLNSIYLTNASNMNWNVTSPGVEFNVSSFNGKWENLTYMKYTNVNGDQYIATSGYVSNSKGGKAIIIGFEFARLPIYQQDYLGNKLLMWLFNITYVSGDQLALTDIIPSTYTPLFSQQINISFYISNLSPVNLTTQLEVLFNGNFYNYYSIPTIPKDGGFIIYNITWNATPPGPSVVTGILDPFHVIPQINYGLDVASSLVNTTIITQYSVLILKIEKTTGHVTGTEALNASLNALGLKYSWYLYSSSSSLNYTNLFKRYNAVIIDTDYTITSGNIGTSSTTYNNLINAIKAYYDLGTTTMSGLFSMAFLGNGTSNLFSKTGGTLDNMFSVEFSGAATLTQSPISNSLYEIYGNNISISSANIFEEYFSNSIGYLISQPTSSSNNNINQVVAENQNVVPVLSTEWGGKGENIALIGNQNGFKFFVGDFGLSQINGIIQLHSSQFEPFHPISEAQMLFTLMLLGYFNYTVHSIIPYVIPSSITFSANVLMIDRYYVINSEIVNLGSIGGNLEVEAYDGSGLFATQTVYIPKLSTVPLQFIWEPQFAALPQSPRDVRIVVSYIAGPSIQNLSFLREGIVTTPVYVFYDNLSTGQNWFSYATVWAYTGVNYYYYDGTYNYYSAEPYNTEGPVFGSGQNGLFVSSNNYRAWGLFDNGISGGYSLGTSYDLFKSNELQWVDGNAYYYIQTNNTQIHGAADAYLQMDAEYMLSQGAEGVAVFVSYSGNSSWYLVLPNQGYPGNVNASALSSSSNNYNYTFNNADLMPAFTGISGGEYMGWVHYTFNLTSVLISIHGKNYYKDSSIRLRFVLILAGSGYQFNIYGNDFFYMDNVKITENGTTGLGNTLPNMWGREKYGNTYVFNSSNISKREVASVISVPITLQDLNNASLSFDTNYSILAWFANASNPMDTPDGFRLYVGVQGSGSHIIWYQLDTRWAGEAGYFTNLQDAASIPSAFYSGLYAFHETGTSISLSGFIGNTIYLKFEVNGDYYIPSYSSPYLTGMYEPPPGDTNYWASFTNVIISGNSYADLIYVNLYW